MRLKRPAVFKWKAGESPERRVIRREEGPAQWIWPKLCGHRGAGKLAPENTLAAFQKAFDLGARMVEVDARLSRDGVAFLMHDERLERCSSGRGRSSKKDWAQLSALDAGIWRGAAWRDERLPSLDQAAAFLIERQMSANVEIKASKGREAETGKAVAERAKALWAGEAPPLISSFSAEALKAARLADPQARLALLTRRLGKNDLPLARELGATALCLNGNRCSLAEARRVREAGFALAFYTINDVDLARKLLNWGADGIITDRIEPLLEGLKSQL